MRVFALRPYQPSARRVYQPAASPERRSATLGLASRTGGRSHTPPHAAAGGDAGRWGPPGFTVFGDNLRFHDNLVFAGPNTSPFLLDPNCWGGHCSGTNLQMFGNTYRFANDPLPFWWDETQYNSIADWQTATGLDLDSQFIIGPFELPTGLEQLKTQPLTRELFEQIIPGCEDSLL